MKNILIKLSDILKSVRYRDKGSEAHASHNRENVTEVYATTSSEYFRLTDAFVRSDFEAVKSAALIVEKTNLNIPIQQFAHDIYLAKNIDIARVALSKISDVYIKLAKESKADLYIIRCTMALNNKGANWLSVGKEVKNPYFGNKMLTCGNLVGNTNE